MHDLEFTGERVVPGKVDAELFLEHVSRYRFAARMVAGREVLDFGCGTGYGAAVLRRGGARRVVGADLSPAAIAYARSRYGERSVHFCVADCEASCFPDRGFDAVVSFELIEHLASYRRFLAEVRRVLRPGGVFVVSTPNKQTYRTAPGTPPNPFHVHEFHLAEFRTALAEFFPAVTVLGQSRTEGVYFYGGAGGGDDARGGRGVRLAGEDPGDPVDPIVRGGDPLAGAAYLIAICSDDRAACRVDEGDLFQVADTNAVRSRELRILELQAELEARTRWAKGLEDESSRRGQRVLELQAELETRTRWARELERESETRARRILELQAELEERLRWATRLEQEREERGRRIVELKGELELLAQSIQRLHGLEDRLSQRIGEVERGLRGELAEMRGEETRRRDRVRALDETVRWHRDSLIWQRQELERQLARLDAVAPEVGALAQRLETALPDLAAWEARFRDVETAAGRARELVDMLWGSRSWRLYAGARRLLGAAGRRRPGAEPSAAAAEPAAAPPADAARPLREPPLEPRPEPAAPAAERRTGPRALIVDHRLPTPDQDAGSVRMVELIRQLQALGYQVVFLPVNLHAMAPYDAGLEALGVEVVVAPEVTSTAEYLEREGGGFDLALVSRFHIAVDCIDQIRELCPNARLVFDTVDLQHLRLQRRAELLGDPALRAEAERIKAAELGVAARADATLVVSDVERELLRRERPGLEVHRVSLIHTVRDDVPGFEEREGFYFVGGFEHPPNVDAARWFVGEVFPELRRLLPEAHLYLLGSKAPPAVRALAGDGVTVCGHVADLERYLTGCRLSIAPLRYGAGIKGKVTQSLACGLPCVMTTVAAEGIGLTSGVDAMIADEPGDFARAVADVYRDPELWRRLSAAGRRTVRARFAPEVARRALAALLDELGCAPPAAAPAGGEG